MFLKIQEHILDLGPVRLNYAEIHIAEGPPLILLHGGSARWQSFQG